MYTSERGEGTRGRGDKGTRGQGDKGTRGRGTVSGKDVNRVGRGFVVDGMYIPRNALHRVAQRRSSLHPRASEDRQPASERRVSTRGVYCVIMDAR